MTLEKSAIAFRTISEVSTMLALQPHVLRFWETKFNQIQPLKRAAGRRFYRPDDVALIGGIQFALHEQGMTIKGVQKLIQDKGVGYMRGLAVAGEAPILVHSAPSAVSDLTELGRNDLQAARQSLKAALATLRDA